MTISITANVVSLNLYWLCIVML